MQFEDCYWENAYAIFKNAYTIGLSNPNSNAVLLTDANAAPSTNESISVKYHVTLNNNTFDGCNYLMYFQNNSNGYVYLNGQNNRIDGTIVRPLHNPNIIAPNFIITLLGTTGGDSKFTLDNGNPFFTGIFAALINFMNLEDGTIIFNNLRLAATDVANGGTYRTLTVPNPDSLAAIIVSATAVTGFTYDNVTQAPIAKTLIVNGSTLPSYCVLNGSTNYEVSRDGINYYNSVNLDSSNGIIKNKTIYIRLKQSSGAGTFNNESITITIPNSSVSKTITVSGIAPVYPTITNTATMTRFNAVINTNSAEQTFIVGGYTLTNNIVITAPTDYEISLTSGSGYASSLTLTQSGGNVSNTTIYLRLKSNATAGNYNENITLSSTGAINKTIALTGLVVTTAPTLSVSPSSLSGYSYIQGPPTATGASQTFVVSGSNLIDNVVLTPSTSFRISLNGSTWFTTPITLTPTGGSLANTTIYVMLVTGLTAGAVSGSVTASASLATSQAVACSGSINQPYSVQTSPSSLTGLNYAVAAGPSAAQSFTVGATYTYTDLVLNAPAHYEISLSSGSGYGSSITLAKSGNAVATTTIYVRLKAGYSAGTYNESITINNTGSGTITSIACSGLVN